MNKERAHWIAVNIQIEMSIRKMTRAQLAWHIGIKTRPLRRRMKGDVEWTYTELETIATLFDTTVDQIIKPPTEAKHRT